MGVEVGALRLKSLREESDPARRGPRRVRIHRYNQSSVSGASLSPCNVTARPLRHVLSIMLLPLSFVAASYDPPFDSFDLFSRQNVDDTAVDSL